VRDEAREKHCRLGDIARIADAAAEVIADVIERHEYHDKPAQKVDRPQPHGFGTPH